MESLATAFDPWMDPLTCINKLVAADATYISLAYNNPELRKIMPSAGEYPASGPRQFFSTFSTVAERWSMSDFGVDTAFGEGEDVAVFRL